MNPTEILKRAIREQQMRITSFAPQRKMYTKDSNILSWSQVTGLPTAQSISMLQNPDGSFVFLAGFDHAH